MARACLQMSRKSVINGLVGFDRSFGEASAAETGSCVRFKPTGGADALSVVVCTVPGSNGLVTLVDVDRMFDVTQGALKVGV